MHTPGIVPLILPAHIIAGGLTLVFGYVALYATKGATLHRKSGMLFVYAMVTMSLSGALMDALKTSRISINVIAGLLTFYLVTTALLTVRNGLRESRWIDATAMLLALTVSVLAPIVVMLYWLVRVRVKRTSRVIVRAPAPDATGLAVSGSASHRAL
jgi:uncharacterized membrane protein